MTRQHQPEKKHRTGVRSRSLRVKPLEDRRLLSAAAGDFNDHGTVDTADYILWHDARETGAPLANDGQLGTPIQNKPVTLRSFSH